MGVTLNGQKFDVGDSFQAYHAMLDDLFDANRPCDDDRPYVSDLNAMIIGELFLHWGSHMCAIYDRSARRVRRDGLDDIALMLVLSGEWRFDFEGEGKRLGSGEIVVLDRARPLRLESEDNRMMNLSLPRHALHDLAVDLDKVHGRTLEGPTAKVLVDLLLSIARHRADSRSLAELVAAFAAAAIKQEAGDEHDPRDTHLKQRAIEYIEANLGDDALCVDTVARFLGTSRAALYRTFAGEGGVQTFIRNRRLSRARRILSANKENRISSVALETGFASPSHFSTSFRKRFGAPPRAFVARREHPVSGMRSLDAGARMERWFSIGSGARA